ncbi:hypothetical protein [Rheinheimera fenheensis]|uniref:hypothetical protein n=1 Tax=Rheinheimera fenheensis TaxID=3152295 RepID=UPI0032600CC0
MSYDIISFGPALTSQLDTSLLFDVSYKEESHSPIDQFIKNTNKINVIVSQLDGITSERSSLYLLGYVSAVESFVRALIRNIIQVDSFSRKAVGEKEIKFSAAMHHEKKLLPEALMDDFSFTKYSNIKDTFKSLIDINININEQIVAEFDKICQLRHCSVHRFGKLGAKNASFLGIDSHSKMLEKPLNIDLNQLFIIFENLRIFVRALNNAVYKAILNRTYPIGKPKDYRVKPENIWSKIYSSDKEKFSGYYNTFRSKLDNFKSPTAKVMYNLFISARQAEQSTQPNQ